MYLTFQVTNGQIDHGYFMPDGQPQQLHVGPFEHAQLMGEYIEVEAVAGEGIERGVAIEDSVNDGGYRVWRIIDSDFPQLGPYEGMCFGSVILHDRFPAKPSDPLVAVR
jgi:hypothetical protein